MTSSWAHHFMCQLILEDDRALSPVTAWRDEPNAATMSSKSALGAPGRAVHEITGSLSAAGLNILTAQIFTRADGIALDTFFVNDSRTGDLASREQRDKFAALLEKVLIGEGVGMCPRSSRGRSPTARFTKPMPGERMTTQINFDNEASDTRTLIEVRTVDRLGLLYAISRHFPNKRSTLPGRAS